MKALRAALPEFAAIHSHVLQDVLARLDTAYHAFFRRVQSGQTPGFPRFQGRNRYHSLTDKEYGNGARLDNGFVVLSTIGRIAVRWSRPLAGTPKTVTIAHEADGWYASLSSAEVPAHPLPRTGGETGSAVGVQVFLITREGDAVANPRHHRKAEKHLQKAQRRVSRRKQGSKRRRKAVKVLAKKHQKVQRHRRDFHFKTALALLRHDDVIDLEDVQVANMLRNRHLATSSSAAGWAQFRSILACRAVYAGKRVVAVPPAYTSQDCSGCGERVQKTLSIRTHVCTSCGLVLDRDENAARNIHRLGQSLRGLAVVTAGMNRASAAL